MSEFLAMDGYGYFIWMSYGVTALFMVGEVVLLVRGRKSLLKRLTRLARVQASERAGDKHSE